MTTTKNRMISILTAFAVILATLTLPPPLKASAMTFDGGSGLPGDPYLISSAATFKAFADALNVSVNREHGLPGQYYKLTANISLSAYGTEWELIKAAFQGHFDGGGFTISGLTINTPDENYVGLFTRVSGGGTVTNLGVSGTVTGNNFVGGVAGSVEDGFVTNCWSAVTVNGNQEVGGVVGQLYQSGSNGANVTNCYSTGAVSGEHRVGGIVGSIYGSGRVANCYATGAVSGRYRVGGIVGYVASDSGYAIVGNVALNPSITKTSTDDEIYSFGRVLGTDIYDLSGLSNNGALSSMEALGGTSFGANPGMVARHGANIGYIPATTQATYETARGWDFTNVWKMGGASYPFPVLQWQNTTPPLPAHLREPLSGTVTLSGEPSVGKTLTAVTTGITSANPGAFSFQWRRGTADIPGATSQTYTLTSADVGFDISCVVTAANYIGSRTSNALRVVAAADVIYLDVVNPVPPAGAAWNYQSATGAYSITSATANVLITGTPPDGEQRYINVGVTNTNATITLKDVSLTTTGTDSPIHLRNGVNNAASLTVFLEGNNTLTATGSNTPGIYVPGASVSGTNSIPATSLTIDGDGTLIVKGNGGGAGIGGSNNSNQIAQSGNITIRGGTVNATGGASAAGIGGGSGGAGGTIRIDGGSITATAGSSTGNALAIGRGNTTSTTGTIRLNGVYNYWTNTANSETGATGPVYGVFTNNTTQFPANHGNRYIKLESTPVRTVSVESQSGTLTAGTAGSAMFVVSTENIESGTAITLNNTNNVAGISLVPAATTGNITTVTVSTTADTPAGNHPLTLTIGGVTSASFNLVVTLPTVTYDLNGGTGTSPIDDKEYHVGETVTVSGAGDFEKTGYMFDGWNTAADGSGTAYAAGDTFTITANVTLYAQWIPDPGSIYVNDPEEQTPLKTITAIRNAVQAALEDEDTVTVTGEYIGANDTLTLNIPAGKTVEWGAEYSGTTTEANTFLVSIGGEGRMEITENGTVQNSSRGAVRIAGDAVLTVNGGTVQAGNSGSNAIRGVDNATVVINSGMVENNSTIRTIEFDGDSALVIHGGTVRNNNNSVRVVWPNFNTTVYITGGTLAAGSVYRPDTATGNAYYIGDNAALFRTSTNEFFTPNTNLFRLDVVPALTTETGDYTYPTQHEGKVTAALPAITGFTFGEITAVNGLASGYTVSGNTVVFAGEYDVDDITLTVTGTLANGKIPVEFTTAAFGVNINTPVYQIKVNVNNSDYGTAFSNYTEAFEDEEITLTANANTGYHFSGWTVIKGSVTISADNKFIMPDEDVEITAVFDECTPSNQAEVNADCTVNLICACDYVITPKKTSHTFTADRKSQGESGHDFKCADCTTRGGLTAHTPSNQAAVDGDCTVDLVCICDYEIAAGNTKHTPNTPQKCTECKNCTTELPPSCNDTCLNCYKEVTTTAEETTTPTPTTTTLAGTTTPTPTTTTVAGTTTPTPTTTTVAGTTTPTPTTTTLAGTTTPTPTTTTIAGTTTPTSTTTGTGTTTTPASTTTVTGTTSNPTSTTTGIGTTTTPASTTTGTSTDITTTPANTTTPASSSTTPASSTSAGTSTTTSASTTTGTGTDITTTPASTTTGTDITTTPASATTSVGTTTTPEVTTTPVGTTTPETTTTPEITSCDCDRIDCTDCNPDGTFLALGDVDGEGGITIFDALEILKYLVGMNNKTQDIPEALRAAIISDSGMSDGKPTIFCALEVLKFLVNMESRVDGVHRHGTPTA